MTASPTTTNSTSSGGAAAISGAGQRPCRRGSGLGLSASLRTIFRRSSSGGTKQKTSAAFLDAFSNHSHHSDGTANTTTLSVSSSLNANSNRPVPASSIEYVARAPFPYRRLAQPAQDVPAQTEASQDEGPLSPTCARSTTNATPAKEGEKKETEAPAQDAPAAQAPMLLRPSLKKTHPDDKSLPRPAQTQVPARPAQARGRRPAQRPCLASLPASLDETWRCHSQCYTHDQHRRRKSLQFDDQVSYAVIPPALHLALGDGNDKVTADDDTDNDIDAQTTNILYYTAAEYASMKDAARADARRIRRLRRQEAAIHADAGNSPAQLLKQHLQGVDETQQAQDAENANDEWEDDLNDWGIEHRTCPPTSRTLRAESVDRVVASVLAEQAAQSESQKKCTILLRLTSREASQVARSEALDRGRMVERACGRWSSPASTTTSTQAFLPSNDKHRDNEANDGDNDATDESFDATLSTSAPCRALLLRRRSFLRRRRSSTSASSPSHTVDNDMMGRRDSMLRRTTPQDTPHVLDGTDISSNDGSAADDNMMLAVADASLDASAPRDLRRRGGSATTSSPLRKAAAPNENINVI